ncbi:CpaF family protein [Candidatus Micrarchaeota archaeon]|nr:CpaF family protein [Candidatus Micrarchaeota archaeon]
MALGWTLVDEGQYRIPWNTQMPPRQMAILDATLDAFAGARPDESVLDHVRGLVKKTCHQLGVRHDSVWAENVAFLAAANLGGFGVLSYLLQDDQLEEIAVIGLNLPIYVYDRKAGWLATNAQVTDLDFALQCVNRMAMALGRRLTSRHPRLSAVLPDGTRLHACIAPVALSGVQISLRKFRQTPLDVAALVKTGLLSPHVASFFQLALPADCSLLVAGNTGSGKTTLLNALSEFIPPSERIVILEDAPELRFHHAHQARLLSGEQPLSALLADTLRMRPDRIVVGEVRTTVEANGLFDVLLSGQAKGAFATFHADSAADALSRLTFMGIRPSDLDALQLVAVLQRYTDLDHGGQDRRALTELSAVHEGRAIPVLDKKGRLNPEFFTTRAGVRMRRSYGLTPEALTRKLSVMAERWR